MTKIFRITAALSFLLLAAGCGKTEKILETECLITSFQFIEHPEIVCDINGSAITATVPYELKDLRMTPAITISNYASITPAPGEKKDFGALGVVYTVVAENTYYYRNYVVQLRYPSIEDSFSGLSLPSGQTYSTGSDITSADYAFKTSAFTCADVNWGGFGYSNQTNFDEADYPVPPATGTDYSDLQYKSADPSAYNPENIFLIGHVGNNENSAAYLEFDVPTDLLSISVCPSAYSYLEMKQKLTAEYDYLKLAIQGINADGTAITPARRVIFGAVREGSEQEYFSQWQTIDLRVGNTKDIRKIRFYMDCNNPNISSLVFCIGKMTYEPKVQPTSDQEE